MAAAVVAAIAVSCLLAWSEYLFLATKPSFMTALLARERLRLFVLAPLPLVVASLAWCALVAAWSRLGERRAAGLLSALAALWPGLVWAVLFLLLLDNFTYTLFRFGVRSGYRYWRLGYALVFAGLWLWGWRLARGVLRRMAGWRRPGAVAGAMLALLLTTWGAALATEGRAPRRPLGAGALPATAAADLPHILLLAADGVSAKYTSAYGYERDTTPALRALAAQSLFCENAFANSLNSSSSIASLLTGKWPVTLKLYYPPQILSGRHAYEHLPALLRRFGYRTVDISARQFADVYDLNFLNGFDEANGRAERRSIWRRLGDLGAGMHAGYFWEVVWERISERLGHIAGRYRGESPYEVVAGDLAGKRVDDAQRVARLLDLLREERARPLFAHLHLLGTHGPYFNPRIPRFSQGIEQKAKFMRDFRDDAIADFDRHLGRIVEALAAAGQWERTIVVVLSDHGQTWNNQRVPLLFRFPWGAHARRVAANAQNLDVAPTLLDYLGVPIPEWMEGASLLRHDPEATRPIFVVATDSAAVNARKGELVRDLMTPPFHGLGRLDVNVGDRVFSLAMKSGDLKTSRLADHTRPLMDAETPTAAVVRHWMRAHLAARGYDVSGARAFEPADAAPGERAPPTAPQAEPGVTREGVR